jgi:transposase-like protein
MGKKPRRTFNAEFKLDTVMEGLRGDKSVSTVCRERDITETLYYKWKQTFVERASDIFEDKRQANGDSKDGRIAELERMVGRLTMEVEILKKAKSWLDTQSKSHAR